MLNLRAVLLLSFVTTFSQAVYQPAWLYECSDSSAFFGPRCLRNKDTTQGQTGLSLGECQLICGPDDRLLWPKPISAVLGTSVFSFDPRIQHIRFENDADEDVRKHLRALIEKRASTLTSVNKEIEKAKHLEISITLENPAYDDLRRDTDESYDISSVDSSFRIKAKNYFGARHAIETMFQLMAFDEVQNRFLTLSTSEIKDRPTFPHRGILFDTVRNFHSVPVLKRLIDGMALSKLNVFHWHLSDSQSFPIALEKYPETTGKMVNYGSYGRNQIYTLLDVAEIVNYAKENGVRVIPEFDMPAHVGYGWQFPGSENFTVCVGKEPWYNFCLEPPCGQLNPLASGMYDILGQLFDEFFDLFKFDSFHMGGDEVNFNCWNTSKEVTDPMIEQGSGLEHDDFVAIWSTFQEKAYGKLREVSPDSEVILWTSTITLENYIHNLPKENYTIQIWTDSSNLEDGQIKTLANEGFKMIFSNFDALYLDCGIANWVGKGSNWCSPYKGWREMYENDLYKILENNGLELTDELKNLVQGAESTMWSEQTDDMMVESMVFPRASALAERLWSNPDNDYLRAETRMVMHRERLVANGVRAASIQPTYCLQFQELCFGDVQQLP